jgi:hypothetical protein
MSIPEVATRMRFAGEPFADNFRGCNLTLMLQAIIAETNLSA